jgi:hypothetical protein
MQVLKKSFYIAIFISIYILFPISLWSQTNIFSENMGTPGSTTVTSSYTGFQNYSFGNIVFSGTSDVRTSLPSSSANYSNASGNGNVFITSTLGNSLVISGINTNNYSSINCSFGIYKSTTSGSGSDLLFEYSTDGTNWTSVSYTLPTGSGTVTWYLRSISNLPAATNLRIRFRQTGASTQYRIDDILISGLVTSSNTVTFNANGGSGNMANQTSSAAANLTSNSFTRTCYAFTGWNTAANGTGTAYADGANYPFTSSTTLYAQWASQNHWTGSANNNNWNNAGNWSCGNVPSATENVLINTGSPALDINYEVPATYTLTLSGTGTLTINPGNKLTITGAADFGNKLVTVAANASNTGAIVLNGGSLQNATNVALQQWFTAQRAWRMLSNPFTTSITGSSISSDNTGFSVNQSGTGDMVVYNSGTNAWSANTTIAANTCYGFFYKGLQSDFNGTPGLSNYSGD